ncbi:transketolase family protein [Candidatus Acetothermia bacterium]|nr:transketolase family protein [Candidatus Acetothermia bacterium]MBI3643778.1 transketolase family protein [Candidatus Acetothermia bacterium]
MKYFIDIARFVDESGKSKSLEKEFIRTSFGNALAELGDQENFVVLGADLDSSTKTIKFRQKFGEYGKEPFGQKGRWVSCGVSEAFMCAAAGGFAAREIKPVITTFARFLERGYEPLLQSVVIPGLDAFVLGSHGGIATGQDGASAQAIEDVAFFRAMHNVTVIAPGDPVETVQATKAAFRQSGLVYMRLSRNQFPNLFGPDYAFKIGEGVELIPGEEITLVTTGETTLQAIMAIAKLQKRGLKPRLIHMPTIQPPDQMILADAAKNSELFITIEDHSPRGGLGDAVLEALSMANAPRRVVKLGVDLYAESGTPADLYKKYGLDADGIAAKTLAAVETQAARHP